MGFYGNITNTSRTQFQFDKIYPNRYEMTLGCAKDGVYLGRYVLIEYDDEYHLDTFLRVQKKGNNFYYNPEGETSFTTLLTRKLIGKGEIVYTSDSVLTPSTGLSPTNCVFYVCTSELNINSNLSATFEEINELNSYGYTANYHIDLRAFHPDGNGRGYDSTVWQKVYTDGKEKYVMIAELNTVVPTFDVSPDAPTMNPVVPHFDTQSTDVYYKLHWQAPWGFRVAAAANNNKSDEETSWTTTLYNPETGKNETGSPIKKPAAIYFNKAAFDKQLNQQNIKKHDNSANEIKVVPVSSGLKIYNDHKNPGKFVAANDIQEMTINLPAIGNMMSDAWDIIHGPNRDNDMRQVDENGNNVSSLQGRLDSIDRMDLNQIPIKLASNGQIVGTTINGSKNKEVSDIMDEEIITSSLQDDAWIKTVIDSKNAPNAISIHHTSHQTNNSESSVDKNTGITKKSPHYKENKVLTENLTNLTNDEIKLYTPYVDAAGHVVGHNIETITLPYSFKTLAISQESSNINGINSIPGNIVADSTQDIIRVSPGNKWIRISIPSDKDDEILFAHEVNDIEIERKPDTDLNNGSNEIIIQDVMFDNAGHMTHNQNHTYILPYGFKFINTNSTSESNENIENIKSEEIKAKNTQDTLNINTGNKWININSNQNDNTLTLVHETHDVIDVVENVVDFNTETGQSFTVYENTGDQAGHLTSRIFHEIILPNNFSQISITNVDNNEEVNFSNLNNKDSINAVNHKDNATFVAGNKWIQLGIENKDEDKDNRTITIYHAAPGTGLNSTVSSNEDINLSFGNSFEIPEIKYDNAGHIAEVGSHKVILPTSGGDLLLTDYPGVNGGFILASDSINGAFEKFEQNYIGEMENLRTVETSVSSLRDNLTADEEILDNILTNISNMKFSDEAVEGQYVSSISQVDGKINITRADLPTYTLTSGDDNGTVKFNETQVLVQGLGTAAYEDSDSFASANILEEATFTYSIDDIDPEIAQLTIAELFNVVANLQAQVNVLQEEVNRLSTFHPVEEESENIIE